MEVKFTKNHYPIARRVTWDDVIKKIDNDVLIYPSKNTPS